MKYFNFPLSIIFLISLLNCTSTNQKNERGEEKPRIEKLGIIAVDLVEATPFVFKNELYRLEWVRPNTKHNPGDTSYLHVVNHETWEELSSFGKRHRFPCAYVENDTIYVIGTYENLGWHGTILTMFKSPDLKTWTTSTIYDAPEELHQICNTSLCKTDEGYTLMFEISGTPEAGAGFTPRFLTSADLITFSLTPSECTYGRDRYSAPHCLRFYNGWYYSFYLEANKPTGYEQYVVRSRDLVHWESSPFNPVLAASEEDKYLARDHFTDEEIKAISEAEDKNNSDIDFCEFEGQLIITYSWGNQRGEEHLAEARYDGTMGQFLEGWFPAEREIKTGE
jgi:hypothetical protein